MQSPEPVAPKPEETKEPPAKASVRKPLPKPDAARHATHVGEFYENDENDDANNGGGGVPQQIKVKVARMVVAAMARRSDQSMCAMRL